jgi:AraC-like DNA-binding protein
LRRPDRNDHRSQCLNPDLLLFFALSVGKALERWLVDRAAHHGPPPLGAAVLDLATGGTTVTAMADRLGYSVRHLHRRCLPLFGYGPQHLARVLRFSRALAAARTGMPLAQVPAKAGFADQAHMSREVRDLAGTTPAQLLRELTG